MSSKYRSVSSRYLATYVVERFSLGNIGISGDWTSKNGISCLLSTTPCLLSTVVSFKYRIVSSRYRSVSSRYHFVSFKYQEVLWALLPYGFAGSSLYNLYNLYTYTEEKKSCLLSTKSVSAPFRICGFIPDTNNSVHLPCYEATTHQGHLRETEFLLCDQSTKELNISHRLLLVCSTFI